MIFLEGYIYQESKIIEDKVAGYSKVIRDLIYKAAHDNILKPNKNNLISDLAKRYSEPLSSDLNGLGIIFANTSEYFYNNQNKTIILPARILTSGLTKKDNIGISHELEHHFQHKNGQYKDEGTYTNIKNKDSYIAYYNDINEINAMLSQISAYIKNANKFREEISDYDFAPFVEEVLIRVLYMDDPGYYLDNLLSEDNRNKVLEFLYLMWKQLKNTKKQ